MNLRDKSSINKSRTYSILSASSELKESGLISKLRMDSMYEISESTDLTTIMKLVRHQPFDLILIQNDLPDMDLTNLVIQARSIDPDAQIVVLSRVISDLEEKLLWKSGIDDVVIYPATEIHYSYRIARALKMRRLSNSNNELTSKNSRLWKVAATDSLTKLLNRRYFTQRFETEFARVQRFGGSMGCIIAEIDNFERIIEQHGSEIGNHILHSIARLLHHTLRRIDTVARYSETEFIMLMPETVEAPLQFVADKLKKRISEYDFRVKDDFGQTFGPQQVSMCMGLISYPDDRVKTASALIDIAEAALIHALRKGGNQIEVG